MLTRPCRTCSTPRESGSNGYDFGSYPDMIRVPMVRKPLFFLFFPSRFCAIIVLWWGAAVNERSPTLSSLAVQTIVTPHRNSLSPRRSSSFTKTVIAEVMLGPRYGSNLLVMYRKGSHHTYHGKQFSTVLFKTTFSVIWCTLRYCVRFPQRT